MRNPFVGKRSAIPTSQNAREGGTFAGKVKSQYKWTRLGLGKEDLRKVKGRNPRAESDGVVRGKSGIYMVHSGKSNTLYVWQRKKGETESRLIYKVGAPKRMPKMLRFFITARRAIYESAQNHFNNLIANRGSDRALLGQFKYGKSNDGIPF
jgi:hypothetical protein